MLEVGIRQNPEFPIDDTVRNILSLPGFWFGVPKMFVTFKVIKVLGLFSLWIFKSLTLVSDSSAPKSSWIPECWEKQEFSTELRRPWEPWWQKHGFDSSQAAFSELITSTPCSGGNRNCDWINKLVKCTWENSHKISTLWCLKVFWIGTDIPVLAGKHTPKSSATDVVCTWNVIDMSWVNICSLCNTLCNSPAK